MDPPIVRQRIPMEDPVVSLCYVTSHDVTLACFIPAFSDVYGASCGMPKCSCDVKYPMVSLYGMWIPYRTPKVPMEEPVVSLCYVTSYDATLVCFIMPAFPDVVHPMICQNVLIVWSIL
ncbi:hypothetical protein CEXT_19731 [Caerostris extrusa]|uniref:Uncharacterized protein n=1 Tax=Caerostris extrusa TaxID=172846 RepID=A0AAV4TNX9_CAEEX|nr:hypothetical protein CEXT_19731 [Caerostris extrusa]